MRRYQRDQDTERDRTRPKTSARAFWTVSASPRPRLRVHRFATSTNTPAARRLFVIRPRRDRRHRDRERVPTDAHSRRSRAMHACVRTERHSPITVALARHRARRRRVPTPGRASANRRARDALGTVRRVVTRYFLDPRCPTPRPRAPFHFLFACFVSSNFFYDGKEDIRRRPRVRR